MLKTQKKLKVLAVSNLMGRPWNRTKGTFNQIIFDRLSRETDLTMLVPVALSEIVANFRGYLQWRKASLALWPYVTFFPYVHLPRIMLHWSPKFMLICMVLFCPRKALFQRYDVAIGSWIFPDAVCTSWLARLRSIPMVAVALGSDINVTAQLPKQRLQIRAMLLSNSSSVAVSQDLIEKMASVGAPQSRLRVIYNGVDLEVFRPRDQLLARAKLGLKTGGKLILFVGNLIKEKGCFELFEAMRQVAKQYRDSQLVYIGDGPVRSELQNMIEASEMAEHVLLAGKVLHHDLGPWFNCADVVCLPSYREGVPNVLMEAMASGVPIVSTNVGGIPEVVPPFAGILVEPTNTDQLATALLAALECHWDNNRILQHVASFTWDKTITQYLGVLENAAHSK